MAIYDLIVRGIARGIGIFSPASAAEYLRHHKQLRKYDSGRIVGVDRQYNPSNKTGDLEIGGDWTGVTSKSRDQARNNAYVADAIRKKTALTVGSALNPQARVKKSDGKTLNQPINALIDGAFDRWAEDCSVDGRDWTDCKKLIAKHTDNDGEIIVMRVSTDRHPFQLQLIEADQIDSSVDGDLKDGAIATRGIEFDQYGRPIAYWILDAHPGGSRLSGKSRRIPADRIIHLFDPDRVSESRGVCHWVSSIIPALSLREHRYAVMDLLRIAAAYGVFIEKENPEDAYYDDDPEETVATTDTGKAKKQKIEYVTPSGLHYLKRGERVATAKPDQPTAEFKDVESSHLRMIALGFGMSYETFTGDLSNVNYSSLKAGQNHERAGFRMTTDFLIRKLGNPVHRGFLDGEVSRNGITLPGYWSNRRAYQAVKWSLPGFPSTDPLKESAADAQDLENGTTSRQQICERRGLDWEEDVLPQLTIERELLEKAGLYRDPAITGTVAAALSQEGKENAK